MLFSGIYIPVTFSKGKESLPLFKVIPVNMIKAKIILKITPAVITTIRCQTGLLRYSQGSGSLFRNSVSILSSTMPEILTYPPNGVAPMQ